MKRNSIILVFLFIQSHGYPQFYGGKGDGVQTSSAISQSLNKQTDYCLGGNEDGYYSAGLFFSPLNNRVHHCFGGTGDGFFSGSGFPGVQNNQFSYCQGGTGDGTSQYGTGIDALNQPFISFQGGCGDGFSLKRSVQMELSPRLFYSFGGKGDGFHAGGSLVTFMLAENRYCHGGIADGSDQLSAFFIMNSQLRYCFGGHSDGFCQSVFDLATLNVFSFRCQGGIADGSSQKATLTSTLNNSIRYCSGGRSDGFHQSSSIPAIINDQRFYCRGGLADGFHSSTTPGSMNDDQQSYCLGGKGDGYSSPFLYFGSFYPFMVTSGGKGDGFHSGFSTDMFTSPGKYCSGGNGDGYHSGLALTMDFGSGIWNGTCSNSWFQPLNWGQHKIPDESTHVVIPSDCPNYPYITHSLSINSTDGTYRCKSLELQSGSGFESTDSLLIHGHLTVAGEYISTNNIDRSQVIRAGGILTLPPTGILKLGNQSTSSGLCDLIIENGGVLDIQGGVLEIDDQVNIMNGGVFNMSEGVLFAHRFGRGSTFNALNPGTFFIEPGVSGILSGGTIKVCGKATTGSYSAVHDRSPGLIFSGNSTLEITQGISSTNEDIDIKTAVGADLMNLVIRKPFTTVAVATDVTISGKIIIHPQSTLKINPGVIVTVKDSVIIKR